MNVYKKTIIKIKMNKNKLSPVTLSSILYILFKNKIINYIID